jgi:hypothetical protein
LADIGRLAPAEPGAVPMPTTIVPTGAAPAVWTDMLRLVAHAVGTYFSAISSSPLIALVPFGPGFARDEAPRRAIIVWAAVVSRPTSTANAGRNKQKTQRPIAPSRARIAAQWSSLHSIRGSAARSFRSVSARLVTRHFSMSEILRRSAGAGRQR